MMMEQELPSLDRRGHSGYQRVAPRGYLQIVETNFRDHLEALTVELGGRSIQTVARSQVLPQKALEKGRSDEWS